MVSPDDVKGLQFRGGSREMDLMLRAAGGIIASVPSNEIYAAMQTDWLDAAVTSSTSRISFRLEEIAKVVTTGRAGSFWFMFEPLLMSKAIFDALPAGQQAALTVAGLAQASFAFEIRTRPANADRGTASGQPRACRPGRGRGHGGPVPNRAPVPDRAPVSDRAPMPHGAPVPDTANAGVTGSRQGSGADSATRGAT